MSKIIYTLPEDQIVFPDPLHCESPDIIAVGGNLEPDRVAFAYQNGIFPWYSEGEPYLWWSPDPRAVLYLKDFHISKSLKKEIRKKIFTIKFDHDFEAIIRNCAEIKRNHEDGTWITEEMIETYLALHNYNIAHSVEAYLDDKLVGGLYGIVTGKIFAGESMFARETNASKICLVHLAELLKKLNFAAIDCQQYTAHLASFGAKTVSRKIFIDELKKGLKETDLKKLGEELANIQDTELNLKI